MVRVMCGVQPKYGKRPKDLSYVDFEGNNKLVDFSKQCECAEERSHCHWVDVNPATLTCWGYYRIVTGLMSIQSPSLVGDTTGLSLG